MGVGSYVGGGGVGRYEGGRGGRYVGVGGGGGGRGGRYVVRRWGRGVVFWGGGK